MGKTPLLPLFAASLGASDAYLGLIVSLSTCTGLILKPFFGHLCDRSGSRRLMWAAALLFALVPFAYSWVDTPDPLTVLRLVHGLSTAMLGPATLYCVIRLSARRRAENIGWFGISRTISGMAGPALAGLLLLKLSPAQVYMASGLFAGLAFPALLALPAAFAEKTPQKPTTNGTPKALRAAMDLAYTRIIWMAGGIEAFMYVVVYTIKAFMPVYALSAGSNIISVVGFLSIQEAVVALFRPIFGRQADRGHMPMVLGTGFICLGFGALAIPFAENYFMLVPGILLGLGQAMIQPTLVARCASAVPLNNLGIAMGTFGAMRNAGKVLGPLTGGLLIAAFGYTDCLIALGALPVLMGAALLLYRLLRALNHGSPAAAEHFLDSITE